MITREKRVVLMDFGIAKLLEEDNVKSLTVTGVGLGTPEYMSPEQGRGMATDSRSDMYSLSVVFYELITGIKPFKGETAVDILVKQATEPVPDPRNYNPEIPVSVKRFLDRAIAKNPDDRYPTMSEFLRDFDGLRLESMTLEVGSLTNSAGFKIHPQPKNPAKSQSSIKIEKSDL